MSTFASSSSPTDSLAELYANQKSAISNILRLERTIAKLEQEVSVLEDKKEIHMEADYYSRTISALERVVQGTASSPDISHLALYRIAHDSKNAALTELEEIKVEQEVEIKEMLDFEAAVVKLDVERKNLLSAELELENIRSKVDKSISSIDQENDFRLWISAAFTLLVALVITGFFLIVIKKENISADIFSGEKGIQFITLFLIIIAVILFGIMGILESRELSALLGALSGYILGRTSTPSNKGEEG